MKRACFHTRQARFGCFARRLSRKMPFCFVGVLIFANFAENLKKIVLNAGYHVMLTR